MKAENTFYHDPVENRQDTKDTKNFFTADAEDAEELP